MDELEQYYQYLKSHGADVPPSYNSFKTTLKDKASATQYYDYLKQNKFDTPDNFDSFAKTFNLGFDSKEVKAQAQSTEDYFNAGLSPEQIQQKKQKQAAPQNESDQFLSIGEPVIQKNNIKGVTPKLTTNEPNIKEAIDRAVDKRIKENRGVYDKTLPAPTDEEKQSVKDGIIQAYQREDLVPEKNSKGESVLKRGTGFIESFNDATTEHYNQGIEDSYVTGLTRDKAIEWLNIKRQNPNAFRPERETAPSGILGETAEFIGENTELLLKGTVGTMAGLTSTLTGGQSFGAFLAMSKDLANSGYSQTLQNNYNRLKQQNPEMSDDDAYDAANKAALVGEAVSLGTGALLSHSVVPKIPKPTIPVNGVTDGITQSFGHALSTSPKVIGSSVVGSVLNDVTSKVLGVDVSLEEVGEHAFETAKQMGVMHFGLWGLAEPYRIPSYLRPQIENVVASAPREEVKQFYQAMEENGGLPQGTTEKVLTDLQKFDEAKSKIPEKLNEEKKAAMAGLLNQRTQLEQDYAKNIAEKDPLFHDGIREDFEKSHEAINKKIEKIYRSDNPFEHEVDSLTGEKPKNVLAEPINLATEEQVKEIHTAAEKADIDINTDEFKAKSNELTGEFHLDNMTPEQLTKINDYINEVKAQKEKSVIEGVEGGASSNELIPAKESSTSNEVVGETIRAAGENKEIVEQNELLKNADIARDILDETSISKDASPLTFDEKDNIHSAINDYEAGRISGEKLRKAMVENGVNEEYLGRQLIERGATSEITKPVALIETSRTEPIHPEILKLEKERDSKIDTALPFIEDAATLKKVYKAKQKVRGKEVDITVGIEQAQIKKGQKVLERILNDCL